MDWLPRISNRKYRILVIAIALLLVCVPSTAAAPKTPSTKPKVVLECWSIYRGIGPYVEKTLFVRLTEDGALTWDEAEAASSYKRKKSKISSESASEIKQWLDSIDRSHLRKYLGPYNTYTDTSVQLVIYAPKKVGESPFTIGNPWPCRLPSCSLGPKKPMPDSVKLFVCEADSLRSRASSTSPHPMCGQLDLPKTKRPVGQLGEGE